jgi:hypothetical protein
MSSKILFPGWNQLSTSEKSLVEEWVSLELRVQEIKRSLLRLDGSNNLERVERKTISPKIIDISSETELAKEAVSIKEISPKTILFVDALKFAQEACRQACNCDGFIGEERDKCRKTCDECKKASTALKLLDF